jgi:signal transduction histidine kinase
MKAQADHIHKLEGLAELTFEDIEGLERSFQQFLTRHADILNLDWDAEHDEDVILKHSSLLELRQELTRLGASFEFFKFYDAWVRSISARSASSLLGPIVDDVQLLAKRSGRKVDFELLGATVKIFSDEEKSVIKNLVHLVRNAVIHGIEEDRGSKPASGKVTLQFKENKQLLEIRCQDDGRGMDRKHLAQMLIEKGLAGTGDIEKKSISELIELLSAEGFTSTREVDLYSGRGVGVASVYAAVRACKGHMDIKTATGQGTEFVISLPRIQELASGLKAV